MNVASVGLSQVSGPGILQKLGLDVASPWTASCAHEVLDYKGMQHLLEYSLEISGSGLWIIHLAADAPALEAICQRTLLDIEGLLPSLLASCHQLKQSNFQWR